MKRKGGSRGLPSSEATDRYFEVRCPVAEDSAERTYVVIPQYVLLGSAEDVADVVRAAQKVRDHAREVASPPRPLSSGAGEGE